jgi:uncharacterized membrane protein
MKRLSRIFIAGIATILPAVATFYLLFWLASGAEDILGRLIRILLPGHLYRPGMGVLAGLVLVLAIGVMMQVLVVRRIFNWGEQALFRVPLVKSIYGSIRDLINFVSHPGREGSGGSQVVIVTLGGTGIEVMGLLTRCDFSDMPSEVAGPDTVAVYLPLSYQIGGHTVLVPRSAVRLVQMSTDRAMRFMITGGMSTGARKMHRP